MVSCAGDYPPGNHRPVFQTAFRQVQGAASATQPGSCSPTFTVPLNDVHGYIRTGLQHFTLEEIRLALAEAMIALDERDAEG